jgi:hypothetical protein
VDNALMDIQIPISLNVVQTEKQISDSIKKIIEQKINSVLNGISTSSSLRSELESVIIDAVSHTQEASSILSGQLQKELLIQNAGQVIYDICRKLVQNMQISKIKNGISISVSKSNFSDVMSANGIQYMTSDGHLVPWLEWLLLRGDDIVIQDFVIGYDKNTGGIVFVPDRYGYRIPPQFSGRAASNWITRALSGIEQGVAKILEREVKRRI